MKHVALGHVGCVATQYPSAIFFFFLLELQNLLRMIHVHTLWWQRRLKRADGEDLESQECFTLECVQGGRHGVSRGWAAEHVWFAVGEGFSRAE